MSLPNQIFSFLKYIFGKLVSFWRPRKPSRDYADASILLRQFGLYNLQKGFWQYPFYMALRAHRRGYAWR